MSGPSPPSSDPIQRCSQDYERQTTGLVASDHPLAKQLKQCDSVDSITAILQEQARVFHELRGDDGMFMKSLKCSVDILYTLSGIVLGEGIGLVRLKTSNRSTLFLTVSLQPFPPAKAIFAGMAILLVVCLFSRFHPRIPVTRKSYRWSKTSVLATTRSSMCLRNCVVRELPQQTQYL
jgi:hypothetical protein